MAKRGRPKVKLEDLPKGWEKKALELAKKGASDVEIRATAFQGMTNADGEEIEDYVMTHELWTRLIQEEPLFFETIKKAKALCEQWWQKEGRTSLRDKDFSYTGWYMNMKNRFGWRDKQDVTTDGEKMEAGVIVLPEINDKE